MTINNTCILGRTYFVERSIHLIKALTINNHRSSGFRSNHRSFIATVLFGMVRNCRTRLIRQLQCCILGVTIYPTENEIELNVADQ